MLDRIKQQNEPDAQSDQTGILMLDGSVLDVSSLAVLPCSTILPSIGEGLIEWAVNARYNQRVRAHLYGALLNYLQMQPDFYVQNDAEGKSSTNFEFIFDFICRKNYFFTHIKLPVFFLIR